MSCRTVKAPLLLLEEWNRGPTHFSGSQTDWSTGLDSPQWFLIHCGRECGRRQKKRICAAFAVICHHCIHFFCWALLGTVTVAVDRVGGTLIPLRIGSFFSFLLDRFSSQNNGSETQEQNQNPTQEPVLSLCESSIYVWTVASLSLCDWNWFSSLLTCSFKQSSDLNSLCTSYLRGKTITHCGPTCNTSTHWIWINYNRIMTYFHSSVFQIRWNADF